MDLNASVGYVDGAVDGGNNAALLTRVMLYKAVVLRRWKRKNIIILFSAVKIEMREFWLL